MAKMKVYEVAKELNKQSKEVIKFLRDQGVDVKSHMSNIEDHAINLVKNRFTTPQAKTNNSIHTTSVGHNNATEARNNTNYQNQNTNKRYERSQGTNQVTTSQNNNNQNNSNNNNNNYNNRNGNNQNSSRPYNRNQNQGNQGGYQGGGNRYSNNSQRPNRNQGNSADTQGKEGSNYRQNNSYSNNRNQSTEQNDGKSSNYQNRRNTNQRSYQGNNQGYQGNQGNNQGNYRGNYQGNNQSSSQGSGNNQGNYRGSYQGNNQSSNQGSGNNQGGNYQGNNNRTGRNPNYRGQQGNTQGQGNNSNYHQNRSNNTGNRSYNNRNNTSGNDMFKKDFIKDELDSSDRRNNASKNKVTKKTDTPIGMSRSETVSRRNNKNVKNKNKAYTNDRNKPDIDDTKIIQKKGQFIKPKPVEVKKEEIKQITVPETLTIKELADKMKITPSTIVKKLFLQGKIVTINQEITFEEAEEIALEFDILVEREVIVDEVEELLKEDEDDPSTLEKRPPVVCVMGHVDHGKTSLLDAIRETSVTSREAGGITQHIGAYIVDVNGEKISFLDTPGHEAFTSMRMRGAKSTDIAILVVAADDGVMPQTVEAINHAKAAGVQIIVAINKIDKPSANIERVKQELTEYELIAEDWGGDTVFVPVSALTKEGIDQLLEMIILTAELLELKANPNRNARGIVIEAELDKGRGPVATVLVQKGTLHVGDSIVAGSAFGKVRAMVDHKGRRVKEATPSTPVEILGLSEVPDAGETFLVTDTEKEARSIASAYVTQSKEKLLANTKAKLSLDGLFSQIQAGNIKDLNIIVKADVQGSVEALKQSLLKLSNDEVAVRIIHGGVGAVTESDVILASASNAIVIGFNVRPDNTAKDVASRENVDIRLYRVIYSAIEDVEAAMKGMLDPTFAEKVLGHAEVRQTFKASGLGTIAGSYITDGKIIRGCQVRIDRDGIVIYDGDLASLKRFKDDVKEVATGYECGLVFEKFNDIKVGDTVEAYIMEEVPR